MVLMLIETACHVFMMCVLVKCLAQRDQMDGSAFISVSSGHAMAVDPHFLFDTRTHKCTVRFLSFVYTRTFQRITVHLYHCLSASA